MLTTKPTKITDTMGYTYIQSKLGNMSTHMAHILTNSSLSNDEWVVSPIYRNNELTTDFQPGIVTGSCHLDELPKDTAVRELHEELLLTTTSDNAKLVDNFITKKGREWYVYHISIDNVQVNDNISCIKKESDDPNRKVVVIVHGSFTSLYAFIKETRDKPRGEEAITGTQLMNVGIIRKLCNNVV